MIDLRIVTAAALLASGTVVATPAAAVITTFANYSGVGGANMYWQRTGTTYTVTTFTPRRVTGTAAQRAAIIAANAAGVAAAAAATNASAASAEATAGGHLFTIATPTATTPGSVATKFTFLQPLLFALGPLDASYTFSAVAAPGTKAVSSFGVDIQPLTSGSFSFLYSGAAPLVVGHSTYLTGANLLTATFFTGGAIVGLNGATSGASANSTTSGGTIVYTSDFLSFVSTNDKDFAISASSIIPSLGFSVHQALNSFKATTTGSFSTDPVPIVTAIVPEPAVWGMLVLGFGLVGTQTRRRASPSSVTA